MINTRNAMHSTIAVPLTIAALLTSTVACSSSTTATSEREAIVYEANNSNADARQSTNGVSNPSQTEVKPTFTTETIASFNEPWAMTALLTPTNTTKKLLVTQKTGELLIVDTETGTKTAVAGVPTVGYGGQGGLGDIIIAPDFAQSNTVYLSYAEAGAGNTYGAKVIKATLTGADTKSPRLQNITSIWEQTPKVKGQGHYSHRLLFSPDGQYLYISSGDRQKKDPAQDMSVNLGKIIRLYPDGSIPRDNPFFTTPGAVQSQFWSIGHRNVLGMAFYKGQLWEHEMGPRGGDEFNLITRGNNYGWPIVSNGRNYSGTDIPDHDTRPEFDAPEVSWTPVISPSSMSIYSAGSRNDFPSWQDNALIGGLSSKALIVVAMNNNQATERYRYDMSERIRSVLAVNGEVFVLEDGDNGRLLKLVSQ